MRPFWNLSLDPVLYILGEVRFGGNLFVYVQIIVVPGLADVELSADHTYRCNLVHSQLPGKQLGRLLLQRPAAPTLRPSHPRPRLTLNSHSALFVSEGTVKTHVNHVFAKLGLRDRAAAVIFALDHNLTGRPS